MQEAVKQLDKIKNFNCSGLIQVFALCYSIRFSFPSLYRSHLDVRAY